MSHKSVSVWVFLLCAGLRLSPAAALKEQKTITAESGQNVTLTCRAPNINIIVAEWSRADLGTEYVLLYRDEQFDPEDQDPSFKNRVDLQDRQMKGGDMSLVLKNVMAADYGTYECRVVQRRTNRRRRANLKTDPISIIDLSVAPPPPGPPGGTTEDEEEEDDGAVRLRVGLSVSAVVLVVAAAGFLLFRNRTHHSPVELQPD